MAEEIWKDVEGYEGLYQVSNLGRVKSLSKNWCHKKEIILIPRKINSGYVFTTLFKNGKSKNITIHRLVAKAFIPNPLKKEQVNHINGIKTDNRIENLEWCTREENKIHALITKGELIKSGGRNGNLKTAKKVKVINLKTDEVLIFESVSAGARHVQVDSSSACKCAKGKIRNIGGYRFEYCK